MRWDLARDGALPLMPSRRVSSVLNGIVPLEAKGDRLDECDGLREEDEMEVLKVKKGRQR